MPKPKPADIQALPELLRMLQSTRDTANASIKLGEALQVSVDAVLEEGRQKVQEHLQKKEVRPVFRYKPLGDNRHAVWFGDVHYHIQARVNFAELDDDEPKFIWQRVPQEPHLAISLFQCLIGVLQDYCQPATGSDIKPVDNLTT